jgi:hypothetical protein
MSINANKLVLHKWNSHYSNQLEKVTIFFLFLLATIIIILFFYVILIKVSPEQLRTIEDWMQWLNNLWEKIKDEPMVLWQIISSSLSYLLLVYIYLSHQRERIFLTQSGIHYQSPWPSFLQWIKPDWFMKWSQIRIAYFKPSIFKFVPGPLSMTLVLETAFFHRKIVPCAWIDLNEPKETRPSMQWHSFSPLQTKHVIPHCPVMKYLNKMGIETKAEQIEKVLKEQPSNFSLESNPHSLIATILIFGFIAYGLIDSLINQEIYAQTPLYEIYIGGGILMALFVIIWLIRAKIPKRESFMIALLIGGIFGFALYPGLLRINQLTDINGLQTHKYVLQEDYSLKPFRNSTLPHLYFEENLEYWSHFEWESIHEIELRKGGLDFYQVNMAPIYADMRQYYRQHD